MGVFFERFYKFATSRRLAVWLIGILLGITLLGAIIPQDSMPAPPISGGHHPVANVFRFLKLNDVFNSYPFFGLLVLLLLNLSFCMSRRVKSIFEDSEVAGRFFSKAGLPLTGSLIFHLSMIIVVSGAVYDMCTKMRGGLIVTEGQEVVENHMSYVHVDEAPLFLENHSFFKLKLKSFDIKFERGIITDTRAIVELADEDFSREYDVRVNKPLRYQGSMLVLQQYGFSPLVTITGPDGQKIVEGYLNLASSDKGIIVEDSLEVPGTDLILKIKLFPDAVMYKGQIRTKSQELKAPKFVVQFDKQLKKSSGLKYRMYKGVVEPGQSVKFKGYRLSIGDIRHWVQFDVTREPGKKIVYAGYWIGLAGISLRLLLIFMKPVEDKEGDADGATEAEASVEAPVLKE